MRRGRRPLRGSRDQFLKRCCGPVFDPSSYLFLNQWCASKHSETNMSEKKDLTCHQCLNLCILSAILLGILYLFFGAFPLVFEKNHGFTISQTGLTFLGLFVGMVLGISSDPLWRRNYARLVRQREAQGGEPGGSEPEFRLPPTIYGALLVPIGLFGRLVVTS